MDEIDKLDNQQEIGGRNISYMLDEMNIIRMGGRWCRDVWSKPQSVLNGSGFFLYLSCSFLPTYLGI